MAKLKDLNRYERILESIFFNHYQPGMEAFDFERIEIETVAAQLAIKLPKNLGDLVYSFRYRAALPPRIAATAPTEKSWLIRSAGRSRYRFVLDDKWSLEPNIRLGHIKVPDATPGVIEKYSLSDEQALLAKLRYNRLVDIFTGLACYSLQNHLLTTVKSLGQVETDEVYIGIDSRGVHYVLPVQAKGGNDQQSVVQIENDFALAAEHFPDLICRPIAAQFMKNGTIALFELQMEEDKVTLRTEAHYRLVPPEELTAEDLQRYRSGK